MHNIHLIRLLIPSLSFLLFYSAHAQTGTIKGIVKDSLTGVVLEGATVSAFGKDSSLLNYKLSDVQGNFSIDKIPIKNSVLLHVSYVGYAPFSRHITLDSILRETTILLSPALNDSNNVTVVSYMPIRMNGDTLEINPAAFKMNPDAVLEEMLTQVPGTTIWSDGTITVNGKEVKNVLVNGKPFMGMGDSRIATQNLPKTAIEKVQLYQEYDRSKMPSIEKKPQDSLLTMNIKLKEESKRGYFGKAGIGYGTRDRFESDLSLQTYNKTTSFGIGGGFNNINKNIGSLEEMFQNNTYRNYNPNLYNVGRFGNDGISKNHSIGGVFTHNFIETTNNRQNDRITINYNKNGSDNFTSDNKLESRTTPDETQFITETGRGNSDNSRHDIGVNYIKTNSYNDNFDVNGRSGFSENNSDNSRRTEVRDSLNNLQSTNDVHTLQHNKSNNQSVSMNFSKTDRNNPLLQFSVRTNLNLNSSSGSRTINSVFDSYTDNNSDTAYNRRYDNDNKSQRFDVSLDYLGLRRLIFGRFSLWGINMSFLQWAAYTKQTNDARTFDFDSLSSAYAINQKLSNHNQRKVMEYTPQLQFAKSIYKWREKGYWYFSTQFKLLDDIKEDKNESTFADRNLSRSFQFFRYEGSVSFQKAKQEKYQYYTNISYQKNFSYPSIDQLRPIEDDINAYYIRKGNPNLGNTTNHNISIYGNFNTENPKSLYSINFSLNGNYNYSQNPITDSVFNDKSGKRTYYYVNADNSKNYNLNYRFNISKKIDKSSIQLMYNGSVSGQNIPNYIDNIYTISQTNSLNNQVSLQFMLKSLIVFNVGKSFSEYHTKQTGQGLTPSSSNSNTTKLGLTVNLSRSFTVNSTFDYTKNKNLEKPMSLWNAFASYRFMKQQGELKFSAMDILKQYQNIFNSTSTYGTTTRITNGLQQYFMLTFSYYPRKFGKTTLKKNTPNNHYDW
ncbi:MAG: carboxypeptidase regulatory-like domain-containing protein [Niabella sp.]